MPLIPLSIEQGFNRILDRLAAVVNNTGVEPNTLSTLGIFPSLIAAWVLAEGEIALGGCFILLGGIFDMIDGKVARMSGRETKFGAIYDATLDRVAELAMYTGIGIYYLVREMHVMALVVVIAAGSSMLVSYVRARAESHGIPCKVGVMRRGDRIVVLGVAAVLGGWEGPFESATLWLWSMFGGHYSSASIPLLLTLAIIVIALFSLVTVFQRLMYIKKTLAG